ncbi:MAG TPA: PilZ domain-containing protein [Beijerinckiaceae bacterium]|jgi:hypothetical protein
MSSYEERRGSKRYAVSLDARIVYNGGRAVLNCRVVDVSATGAKLELDERVSVPERFTLVIDTLGESHSARLAWRAGSGVGVAFAPRAGAGEGFGRRSERPAMAPPPPPRRRWALLRALLDR